MPTYQYACTSCGEELEVFQSFTDPTLTVHEPGCGGPLRKVFGSVGVVFKGSGFYRTDSRKGPVEPGTAKGESKSDGAKSDGPKSDGAKSDGAKSDSAAPATKTESKPAAKTESSAPKKSGGSTAAA